MSDDQVVHALREVASEVRGMRTDVSALTERITVVEVTVRERRTWCDEHGRQLDEHDERLDQIEAAFQIGRAGWLARWLCVAAVEVLRWIFDYFRGGGGR